MGINEEYLTTIFEKIDGYFIDEVGPVAFIICEEAKAEWVNNLSSRGKSQSLRLIPSYVKKLSENIDDVNRKHKFLDAVYSIESLSIFKK